MRWNRCTLRLLVVLAAVVPPFAFAGVTVTGLRCEYLENPLGIDVVEPRLNWAIESEARGECQTAFRVLVASSAELLARDRGDLWDSGKVPTNQSVHVEYAGLPLRSGQECFWKVRVWGKSGRASDWSKTGRWTMGLLGAEDWRAQWISSPDGVGRGKPEPWFRKTFPLSAAPKRAVLYVASIGYHELFLNGRKVGDTVLAPAVVNYRQRVRYVTYDVTSELQHGTNCIGLWLGSGWSTHADYGLTNGAMLLAQLHVTAADGSEQMIPTDESWKTTASHVTAIGGWQWSDYGGESVDDRRNDPRWCAPDFDDAQWKPVRVFARQPQVFSAEMVEPNRRVETLSPQRITRDTNGTVRVDFGRAFTGWLEVNSIVPEGRRVTFEYSDQPDRDMVFKQYDEFIGAGRKGVFRNHFNYRGFRWVTIKGLDAIPDADDVRGYLVRSDFSRTATFECSDERINQLHQLANWTYQSLSLGGYVVDCPHRERFGYGGDAHATMDIGLTDFGTGALYTKWLEDWRDCQKPDGDLPNTAPTYIGGGGPAWGGICVMLPWEMYVRFGDRRVLERNFPMIQRWLEFLESKSSGDLLQRYPPGDDWQFLGDWVAPGRGLWPGQRVDDRSTLFFNNCYWLLNLQSAERIARVLGRGQEADRYQTRGAAVRAALQWEFFAPAHNSYVNGEQTYLAFPLWLGIPPEPLRGRVAANLVAAITSTNQGHINTGMHGTWIITKYLTEIGRNDLLFTMATQQTFPGWGYMLERDATTMWELWNGEESRIHATLMGVGGWFQQGLVGIRADPQRPGGEHFIIRPPAKPELSSARGSLDTLRGHIACEWRRAGREFSLKVTLPPNVCATVFVPAKAAGQVTESGHPLTKAAGVKLLRMTEDAAVCEIGAGTYQFKQTTR